MGLGGWKVHVDGIECCLLSALDSRDEQFVYQKTNLEVLLMLAAGFLLFPF